MSTTSTLASDRTLENLQTIDDLAGAIATLCRPVADGNPTVADARTAARQAVTLASQIQGLVDQLAIELTEPVMVVEAAR